MARKNKPYRAAVIGCGFIGSRFNETPPDDRVSGDGNVYSHASAYATCPDTALMALCDVNPDRLNEAAAYWGVSETYRDPAHLLLKARPEIVSICSPDGDHAAHLELALNCPTVKAILCEKPIALDAAPAQHLVEKAHESGRLLAINYSRRYDAGHARVKTILDRGQLGKIQQVTGFYTKGIIHNGSHMIDLLRWFFGEVVRAEHRGISGDSLAGVTVDADLLLGQGVRVTLRGCDGNAFNLFEVDIIGTKGRIRLERSGNLITQWKVIKDPNYPGYKALGEAKILSDRITNTTLHAVEDLIACLSGERAKPRCTGHDALRALEVTQGLARPHPLPLQELKNHV